MFRQGKVLKVKVELSPEVVGFGRATIVEVDGNRIFLQLKTAKGEKRTLPKGTRVWFVSDSVDNPFNGLWSTTIVSHKMIGGKTALECARPKFEAVVQRRKQKRLTVSCPVRVHGEQFDKLRCNTRNLSRSGSGIEVFDDCEELFSVGHNITVTIDSQTGPIDCTARIIQSRYNWLANKTDIGLEFVEISQETQAALERLMQSSLEQPQHAPSGKEKGGQANGQLSSWLKSTKDNVSFIKTAETPATSLLSEEDLDELEAEDDDDCDDDNVTD